MTDFPAPHIFIVGCPRSGTTLLLSCLGAHPLIKALPETDFLCFLAGQREDRLNGLPPRGLSHLFKRRLSDLRIAMGISSQSGIEKVRNRLSGIDPTIAFAGYPASPRSLKRQIGAVVSLLDNIAAGEGKKAWVEKTPVHLFYLDIIQRYISGAKVVHIIRKGTENVASLYDVATRYPERWSYYNTADRCVDRWNRAVSVSVSCHGQANHLVVCYEQLADDTERVLRNVCKFLGLSYDESMLTRRAGVAESVRFDSEKWKAGTGDPIARTEGKYTKLFTDDQRRRIESCLLKIDLEEYYFK